MGDGKKNKEVVIGLKKWRHLGVEGNRTLATGMFFREHGLRVGVEAPKGVDPALQSAYKHPPDNPIKHSRGRFYNCV